MNRTHFSFATLLAITASVALAPIASAQDADDDFPPSETIATVTPVYFEGHAAYWWHNRWHYRDPHGAWLRYHAEPTFLRDHRVAHPYVEHRYYTTGHQGARPIVVHHR